MTKARSMTRNHKHDGASSTKRIKTCDHTGGVAPWADLTHDVLNLVMMKLGVVDFLAFSRVCKSWRSLTLSNRSKFMASKSPMAICMSTTDANEKECHLEDLEGRKLKTIVPHLDGRECIGVTCGYLILFGEKSNDYWLVNLITRHELHFPGIPNKIFWRPSDHRAILFISPSISGWVFVVFNKCFNRIWFCIAGKQEWTKLSIPYPIHDLIAFNGKIYSLLYVFQSYEMRLCEMKLYPVAELVLLGFSIAAFRAPRFVTSGENLYVIDRSSKHPYKIHEIDIDENKWVSCEKEAGEEYSFFCSDLTYGNVVILSKSWPDHHSKYRRYALTTERGEGRIFNAKMWYFFHDWLNVNLMHE